MTVVDPGTPTGDGPGGFTPVVGARVVLRPIVPTDHQALFRLEQRGELGRRWRSKGSTPSFDAWLANLWRGVQAQFVVAARKGGRPVGLVTLYNANHRDGWAYVAVIKFDEQDRSGLVLDGLVLFLAYVMSTWPLRKLYAEVAGYNLDQFGGSLASFVVEEGRLTEHEFNGGRWWDLHLLALRRETWLAWEPILLPRVALGEKFRQPDGPVRPTRLWVDRPARAAR